MISPHPDTTRQVVEAARRERLARLAKAHRHPGPISMIWARFNPGPVIRWFELRARRLPAPASPARHTAPVQETSTASPGDG